MNYLSKGLTVFIVLEGLTINFYAGDDLAHRRFLAMTVGLVCVLFLSGVLWLKLASDRYFDIKKSEAARDAVWYKIMHPEVAADKEAPRG